MNRTLDRITTALVTATVVSAGWILFGSYFLTGRSLGGSEIEAEAPASAMPAPGQSPAETSAASQHGEATIRPSREETYQLTIPVLDVSADELTDSYSDDRAGGSRLHEAIDIMAPTGTSVIAAAPGEVERIFLSDAGGKTVYVRSPDRLTIYYYAHLDDYAPGLKEGQTIRRGQRLGTVGSSGNADPEAPHLHFAIMRTTKDAQWWEPSTAINPYPLLTRER
ncbi:M23 family metallopeptidase [Paraurantiacibacter namhicola]|nr:M23 family metallopeptidase [Paraurantiacibacter namhicola]